MNLILCKKSDLKKTPRTNLFRLLTEFAESGAECALVAGAAEHYATPNGGARSINGAIKHYRLAGIKATNNGGQIYLVRKDDYER